MNNLNFNYLVIVALLCGIAVAGVWEVTSEFTADSFDKQALSSWKLENFTQPFVSSCGNVKLVGGYNVSAWASLSKSFPISVAAKSLQISFDLYLIDNWTTGWEADKRRDKFQMKVNGVQQVILASHFQKGIHATSPNLCGQTTADRQTHIGLTIPFTDSNLDLQLQGVFDDNTHPWWGIRNLKIYANYGEDEGNTVAVSELSKVASFGDSNWKNTGSGNHLMKCGSDQIFGGIPNTGSGTTFTRVINNLPSHTFVTIKLKTFWLDSIDSNDSVIFYLDDKIVHEQGKNWNFATDNICGQEKYKEAVQDIVILTAHTNPTATFKILVNTDQPSSDESFGFRDFSFSTSKPCPVIYNKANGEGNQLQFCGDIPNLKEYGWTDPIKGIYIPLNKEVVIYQKAQYEGKKLVIGSTNLDLTGKQYVLINRAFNIEVSDHETHLRHY